MVWEFQYRYPLLQKYLGITLYGYDFQSLCKLQLTPDKLNLQGKNGKKVCAIVTILSKAIKLTQIWAQN